MSKPVTVGVIDKQPNVLSFAIRAARDEKSPLRVVHSAGFSPQVADVYAGMEVIEDLRREGQRVLDDVKEYIEHEAPDVGAEYILTSEAPVRSLEHGSRGSRLLVVGSDQVRWFDRLVQSSVAGHLALHASCPVVVVPMLDYAEDHDGDIVLALDGDTAAEGPIRFAFEQASARRAPLHVLHAVATGQTADDAEEERANVSEVLAGWRASYPDTRVYTSLPVDSPAASVVRATELAGLVIVGRPHSTRVGPSRPLATQVLRDAHCPVAVIPASYDGV